MFKKMVLSVASLVGIMLTALLIMVSAGLIASVFCPSSKPVVNAVVDTKAQADVVAKDLDDKFGNQGMVVHVKKVNNSYVVTSYWLY